MEIFEDLADVDSVFVAVGGGGLIGGIAAYLKSVKPGIKVKGLNEEGKWTFFLNVHRMIRESHATLLVGFSIAGGYRRPTAACKNSYHRLLSLQSGSSVWILPCGFFFRAQTPITPSAASGKSYWKQNFCIGWNLRAYVSLYEHNSQTLSKASARGSSMTGSMPTTAVLQNKRKKIKKFIER